ncbi:protein disulfide-isomerase 1-like [Dendronephthya gigantea]|uniref:protein disulfide-isomerase 1-like n=1 Tax=Dendronephthya gigantea TaxID=151771 RepID=UPI001069AC6A|nr:protein disulfide-isomerase 1-like [Dendronephthya gigantea]
MNNFPNLLYETCITCTIISFLFLGLCVPGNAKDLPELREANFDNVVNGSNFVFVIFYAPWNERSVEALKTLEKASEELNRSDIILGKVNAYDEVKLATRFWIDHWPIFKFFLKGSETPETYRGGMKLDDFLGFIKVTSGVQADPRVFDQAIIELDGTNFERIIHNKKKNVFLLFYAKWCNSCKDLINTVEKVGKNFQNEKDCVIAKIDGDANYDVTVQQEVPHYPSIRVYTIKNKDGYLYHPGRYQENWSEQNMTKFLNLQCKTKRTIMGRLDDTAGRLKDFEKLVKVFMQNSFKRSDILDEALSLKDGHKESSAAIYVNIMQRVLKDGTEYLATELNRIERLMQASMHLDKADEFQRRKNILNEFAVLYRKREEL